MGYRRVPTVYTLDSIPEEEGLIVRMTSIRLGKMRRLMTLTADDKADDAAMGEILDLFQQSLVSWNLEEFEDGTPVPTTREGVEDQEVELIMRIVGAWMDEMTGTDGPDDLGKGSTGGGKFPGRPLTMEAL
ncbi:MAG TPA: hypothetical protein VJQ57_13775 [Acidimicrobiia bacterium]|nr:hypothetical protein [Acidimicrobiia bacterium]